MLISLVLFVFFLCHQMHQESTPLSIFAKFHRQPIRTHLEIEFGQQEARSIGVLDHSAAQHSQPRIQSVERKQVLLRNEVKRRRNDLLFISFCFQAKNEKSGKWTRLLGAKMLKTIFKAVMCNLNFGGFLGYFLHYSKILPISEDRHFFHPILTKISGQPPISQK